MTVDTLREIYNTENIVVPDVCTLTTM